MLEQNNLRVDGPLQLDARMVSRINFKRNITNAEVKNENEIT